MVLFNLNACFLVAVALCFTAVTGSQVEKRDFDVFDFVDPLIGTSNGGKTILQAIGSLD